MRELKFRCWCPYNKEMYTEENSPEYSFEVANGGISMIPHNGFELYTFETNIQDDGRNSFLNIIPMQFTGLKDKNGIDIYEGDILSNGAPSQNIAVKYERGAFWCYPDELLGYETEAKYDMDSAPYICFHDCEPSKWATIVGNIYEHPHLLKKDK